MKGSNVKKRILITGGSGFIGSHLVRKFVRKYPEYQVYNLDLLTYAGHKENLNDISEFSNYTFIQGDIADEQLVHSLFTLHRFDAVIHLAAESHVDRSIRSPMRFVLTNVVGTVNLLQAFKSLWSSDWSDKLFYHISTDEVYGSLGDTGLFTESTAYDPNSPYSASKASSDHFVRAYGATYGLPFVMSNCSNNYGPYQFPEKLIPLCIHNILKRQEIPIYGTGLYTRDWLYVGDHVEAIDTLFHRGRLGETYNIGGRNEWTNIDLVHEIGSQLDVLLGRESGDFKELIRFVTDRPGHDLRYAIDSTKIESELNWKPQYDFETGLAATIAWYLEHESWLNSIQEKAYQGLSGTNGA